MDRPIDALVDDLIFQNILHESLESHQKSLFQKCLQFQIVLSKKEFESNHKTKMFCLICMDEIKNKEMVYDLKCNHLFHCSCLDESVKFQHFCCPICRNPFPVRNTSRHYIEYH